MSTSEMNELDAWRQRRLGAILMAGAIPFAFMATIIRDDQLLSNLGPALLAALCLLAGYFTHRSGRSRTPIASTTGRLLLGLSAAAVLVSTLALIL